MTPKQHFDNICNWFRVKGEAKYFRGQKEHGGRLWRKPCLKLLGEEILDMPIYFRVLEEQHELALDYLALALADWTDDNDLSSIMPHTDKANVRNAYNILRFGNPEGEVEEEK